MTRTRFWFFWLLLQIFIGVGQPLHCYNCLAFECAKALSGDDCEELKSAVTLELRSYYDIETFLPSCHPINETLQWRIAQVESQGCKSSLSSQAFCARGRIEVSIISSPDSDYEIKNIQPSYATILGCAQVKLSTLIKSAQRERNGCFFITQILKSINGKRLKFSLENCPRPQDFCNQNDFCIHYKESAVKPFRYDENSKAFEVGVVVAIISLASVVLIALLAAAICRWPVNRPANFEKGNPAPMTSIEAPVSLEEPCESVCSFKAVRASNKIYHPTILNVVADKRLSSESSNTSDTLI